MNRRHIRVIDNIIMAVCLISAAVISAGCDPFCGDISNDPPTPEEISRRNVLLLYSAGYNSLSQFLDSDVKDLKTGWLPGNAGADNILLVYKHNTAGYNNYMTHNSPNLIRLYRDKKGNVVSDTLMTYPEETISSSARMLNEVLNFVKDEFPAKGYGLIFSSHATGYLPAGYYSNPTNYQYQEGPELFGTGIFSDPVPVPYVEVEHDPSLPMVKSIGEDHRKSGGGFISYEMELQDFADAIPMKLDYILFDACLMGGIEVAYELKDKCRRIGFSQAEVLAEGLDYSTLTTHLLQNAEPDPQGVCEDYFKQYDIESGVYRSATISYIDCEMLEPLAEVCRDLFSIHSNGISWIRPNNVQRFYRSDKHWFYDLESIIFESGATKEEINRLHDALKGCVLYAAHTPTFMLEFEINTFSGFSMYLPSNGSVELNKYYKTLKWNKATGLVK
jgi:hypothetical protein